MKSKPSFQKKENKYIPHQIDLLQAEKLGKYVSHSNPIHGLMSLDTKKVQYTKSLKK